MNAVALKGEFDASIGGEPLRFDTRLGTIASIEERCGDLPIVELVEKAVLGRRARDRLALLEAAVSGLGHADGAARVAGATMVEAEAFLLALMRALGFTLAPRREAEGADPLAGPSDGAAGGPSRSEP